MLTNKFADLNKKSTGINNMKRFVIFLVFLSFSICAFSKPAKHSEIGNTVPAKLVAQIYNIYKTQNYRKGLKITTGTMKKRFKKLYDYLRMHQQRVPAKLQRLSGMMHGYRFVGQYNQKYKGRKYAIIDCIWVLKYRDNEKYGSGILRKKLVVRSYLVKKVSGKWKVSSEKFVTEHIIRDEEIKFNKMIQRKIQQQRMRRRRRMRGRGRGRYRYYRR
jgi:hypothetical protein